MVITIHNVDDLVFSDKQIQKEFTELKPLFDQWLLGIRVPAVRFLAQKSRLEILEKFNTENNRAILSKYFQETVSIQTIEYRRVNNLTVSLNEVERELANLTGVVKFLTISRDADRVYISMLR